MKKLFLPLTLALLTSITSTMWYPAAADEFATTTDPQLEELRNLQGDCNWPHRKKLIMRMIKENPANVDVDGYNYDAPLKEAITFGDVPFAHYLLQHNADVKKMEAASHHYIGILPASMVLFLFPMTIT